MRLSGQALRQWPGEHLHVPSRLSEQALGSPGRRGRPPRRLARSSSSSWPMLTDRPCLCAVADKLKGSGGPSPPPRSNGGPIAAPANTPPALPQPSLCTDQRLLHEPVVVVTWRDMIKRRREVWHVQWQAKQGGGAEADGGCAGWTRTGRVVCVQGTWGKNGGLQDTCMAACRTTLCENGVGVQIKMRGVSRGKESRLTGCAGRPCPAAHAARCQVPKWSQTWHGRWPLNHSHCPNPYQMSPVRPRGSSRHG